MQSRWLIRWAVRASVGGLGAGPPATEAKSEANSPDIGAFLLFFVVTTKKESLSGLAIFFLKSVCLVPPRIFGPGCKHMRAVGFGNPAGVPVFRCQLAKLSS